MEERNVPFVISTDFLRGSFDGGLSIDYAICELVDNSLDAGARNIWIILDNTQGKRMHIIVGDNGEGIPTRIEHEEGNDEGIPYVMAFGSGKNMMGRKGGDIGIFGLGLSKTITGLARDEGRAIIFSKNEENSDWRSCIYEFNDIVQNDCMLPQEKFRPLPFHPPADTGTVIDIELNDGEDMRPGSHKDRLLSMLGRVYRKSIADGVTIHVGVQGKKSNSMSVTRRFDPLCLDPEAFETQLLGVAKSYDVPSLVFDTNNPLGEIIDPATGQPAVMTFQLSLAPKARVRLRLEDKLAGKDVPAQQKVMKRFGFGQDGQGFSLLREGRELAEGKPFGIFAKHPWYNYMKGEINFPVCLDDLFTVQANKSRFDLKPALKTLLKTHLKPYTDMVVRDVRSKPPKEDNAGAQPVAERLAKQLRPLLPQAKIDAEEQQQGKEVRQKMRNLFVTEAQQESQPLMKQLQQDLSDAKDPQSKEDAKAAIKEAQDHLGEMIRRIENRWDTASGIRILEEALGHRDLYELRDAGDEAHIVINTETTFYNLVYSKVKGDDHLRGLLDLMLASIGYSEFFDGKSGDDQLKGYWIRARQEISLNAADFVQSMPTSKQEAVE